jgi:hypothetical protein
VRSNISGLCDGKEIAVQLLDCPEKVGADDMVSGFCVSVYTLLERTTPHSR